MQQSVKMVVLSVGNRIEVANGNGREGMAKAVAHILNSRHEWVWRISNAQPFNQEKTTIYYQPGKQIEAEQLAIKVPGDVLLEERAAKEVDSDLRLVIGHDFRFKNAEGLLMLANENNNIELQTHYVNVILIPARIEVANGNGHEGMARKLSVMLARHGEKISRVTNADHFNHHTSVIYYLPNRRKEAEKVAAMLPVKMELKAMDITHRRVDIRIVIGQDILEAAGGLGMLSASTNG